MQHELRFLPGEAPTWTKQLQLDIHLMLRLQLIILRKLGHVDKELYMVDRTLDDVLADIAAEKTQIASLSTLTAGIKQKLDDALSGVTLPADAQAKINAIFDGIESNKQDVVNAINANTPAEGTDPGAPGEGSGAAS